MRVVLSTYWVTEHLEAGGHFWVYAQYADALRRLGCDVWWLEEMSSSKDGHAADAAARVLRERLAHLGLGDRLILYRWASDGDGSRAHPSYLDVDADRAEQVFRGTDLLLNFHYALPATMLARFTRTALVDIDPGLLQLWWTNEQLDVSRHDTYFSIGENLPDVPAHEGARWVHTAPAVSLPLWPYAFDPAASRFTTVTSWDSHTYVTMDGALFDTNKRRSYLDHHDVPRRTGRQLEIATIFGASELAHRRLLETGGWSVRDPRVVAGTPQAYRSYIQGSRGEFSCAKPAYVVLRNAWFSDRTACYLASGKPAVVQDTGPSRYLPSGLGLLRFSSPDEAVAAVADVDAHYEKHCRAAREIAETYLSATDVVTRMLDCAVAG
ncbi:hypothetical protein [Nocardioides iriomotensis]|uniref:Glycosyltransferase family 1 protein n=1 Tax=Nocardioides iriomotensis TaxID=715784 RepID=A0A4Q5JAV5_9ACTN|nr:hypothetical protein [Nocardioides iriomotensis]RYU15099.1 hypothetical protein ETU37_01840 [Nocardioides iriomotensis]